MYFGSVLRRALLASQRPLQPDMLVSTMSKPAAAVWAASFESYASWDEQKRVGTRDRAL